MRRRLAPSRRAAVAAMLIAALGLPASGVAIPPSTGQASAAVLPPAPTSWSVRAYSPAAEQLLVALTDGARASAGLPPLAVDARLASLARWRSRDMAQRGYFSHQIPPGNTTVFDVMHATGIRFSYVAENIGWTSASAGAATATIERVFLASPEHRANILGTHYDAIGVGAYRGADGRDYFTVLFMAGSAMNTLPPLTATGRVAGRIVAGTRVTALATASGGAYPYRMGWYVDARRIGSGPRVSFASWSVGAHVLRLVVVDANGVILRHSWPISIVAR